MFCKIDLIPKEDKFDYDKMVDALWDFSSVLYYNGQILKNYKLIFDKIFTLYVNFPKTDSFDEKYDNVYVKRERAKIKELFDYEVTYLGRNLLSTDYCECKKRSAIEMQTDLIDIDSVFTCCDCGKPVALYELPFCDEEKEYWCVNNWQQNFSSMHRLWMNGLCDRYTGNQLVNLDSALNRDGLSIAEDMRKKLDCKVYYNAFDDLTGKVKYNMVGDTAIRYCPKCGNLMRRVKFTENYEVDVCDPCNLTSDVIQNP